MVLPTGYRKARNKKHHEHEIKALLDGCEILAKGRKGEYVCFPITTGRRLWRLATTHALDLEMVKGRLAKKCGYQARVIDDNLIEGRKFVAAIERKHPFLPVYDPSRLWILGWTQDNYYRFWEHVIREKISRIHLIKGWQYSQGCVLECVSAFELGVRVFGHERRAISRTQCLRLIEKAMQEGIRHGFNVEFLSDAVVRLRAHAVRA